MARRPSDEWRRRVAEEAAELEQGSLSPADASAAVLWPESLLSGPRSRASSARLRLRRMRTSWARSGV